MQIIENIPDYMIVELMEMDDSIKKAEELQIAKSTTNILQNIKLKKTKQTYCNHIQQ